MPDLSVERLVELLEVMFPTGTTPDRAAAQLEKISGGKIQARRETI